jgi:flagellar protein FliT
MTGMNNDQILATYEAVSRLTRRMLTAARNSEWDMLVKLERDCSALFARLFTGDNEQPQSADFQRRKAQLIRGVLDDDAEIRLLVEPWLNQLSALISHAGHQRRLSQAYRAGQ